MRQRVSVPAVWLAIHLGAIVWVASSCERSNNFWLLLAVSALPLAQASLLAAWGAWGRWPFYVRASVVAIGVTALWAVECHVLNLKLSSFWSTGHAVAFTVQAILIGGVLMTIRLGRWYIRRRRADEKRPWRVQFSIGRLLGWTAAIALVLGFWKSVLIHTGWAWEKVLNENSFVFLLFGGVVGVYHATFALIVLGCVWCGRPRYRVLAQGVLALVLVCAIASSMSIVLGSLFKTGGGVGISEWVVQSGFQALYLLITLVPIRLSEYNQAEEPCP